jgi:hypothetical protein
MSACAPWEGSRLIHAALRCYPARWRRRHADEAAELAALLIRDGTPAASIALSYLAGAARERLTPRPGRSLSSVAAALLAATCLLGFSAALVAETVPARAASTPQSPSSPVAPKIRPAPSGAVPSSPHPFIPCRPGGSSAAGHSRVSIQATAHAGSC